MSTAFVVTGFGFCAFALGPIEHNPDTPGCSSSKGPGLDQYGQAMTRRWGCFR